jgi:hypothetical protein
MKFQTRREAVRQDGGKKVVFLVILISSVIVLAAIVKYYKTSYGTHNCRAHGLVEPYLKQYSEADVVNFEVISFHDDYVYPVNYYFQIFPVDTLDFVEYFNLKACSSGAKEANLQYDPCDLLGMNISAHGSFNLLPRWWKSSGHNFPVYAKLIDVNAPKKSPDFMESWDGKFLVYFSADTANICVELLMK